MLLPLQNKGQFFPHTVSSGDFVPIIINKFLTILQESIMTLKIFFLDIYPDMLLISMTFKFYIKWMEKIYTNFLIIQGLLRSNLILYSTVIQNRIVQFNRKLYKFKLRQISINNLWHILNLNQIMKEFFK